MTRRVLFRDGCHFHVSDGLVLSHDCERCFCGYGVLSSVCIPGCVRELCDNCFKGHRSLRRVTFGSSSLLERIGVSCFEGTGVEEVGIPDGVRDLCDCCFKGCKNFRHVTFGSSSLLERIGVSCFEKTGVEDVRLPDSVRELCDDCFKGCRSLCHVTFGSSSALDRVGRFCFAGSGLVEISIPDGVFELCEGCFKGCKSLCRVTFGSSSSLERIGLEAFGPKKGRWKPRICGLVEISIPDSVCELCDGCFKGCEMLRRVTFGPWSSLERIGVETFGAVQGYMHPTPCGLLEISIPDGVHELCDGCFKGCSGLHRVTFGPSSSLERIGVEAFGPVLNWFGKFCPCGLVEISIPASVCELCDGCFNRCISLRHVTFGSSSLLERIGPFKARCFVGCDLEICVFELEILGHSEHAVTTLKGPEGMGTNCA